MKLLLIDDHPLFSVGFAHALGQVASGVEVLTAPTIQDGLNQAAAWPGLDIVLIDYRLGDTDGLAGLRRFGERFPLVARVLISGDEDPALAQRARAAGASGFLGKSASIAALLAALQRVASGDVVFDDAALRVCRAGATARQMEVLTLVAQGQPNKRIALELGIAERTVKLHVTALLDALGARNRTHLLVRAREQGLL
ncbi:MAG: response regulator transcription factor [Hydrogenophaga sp.]|uniref:response regulator transcription factor n=1 Tax=Hydrogenophaga sp. TaxID=1904254 RepID=UPI0026176C10|nr:response regulator transcription factor [Hydrogenophaga sp.]MCV0440133.1 response regulator transcription factor [Hydrogenophaga sp.]